MGQPSGLFLHTNVWSSREYWTGDVYLVVIFISWYVKPWERIRYHKRACTEIRDKVLYKNLYLDIEHRKNLQMSQLWPETECILSGRRYFFPNSYIFIQNFNVKKLEMLNMLLPLQKKFSILIKCLSYFTAYEAVSDFLWFLWVRYLFRIIRH